MTPRNHSGLTRKNVAGYAPGRCLFEVGAYSRPGRLLNFHHFKPYIFSKFISYQQNKEERLRLPSIYDFTFISIFWRGVGAYSRIDSY